jgi:hypothetical protein
MPDTAAGFYPAHPWHIHVQQHCIEPHRANQRQRFFAASRFHNSEAQAG